jgi:hypothetical protein
MTDQPGMNDPESDLYNAALADVLRELLHTAPRAGIDPAQRAAQVSAAIQRAWPHGIPPAAEPGHQQGSHGGPADAPSQAAHATPRPEHLHELGQHHPAGPLGHGHPADLPHGEPGPGHPGPPGDPHTGH